MIKSLTKTVAVVVGSTVLATLAVNAMDIGGHASFSLLGLVFGGAREDSGPCPENMALVTQALVPFCADIYEVSTAKDCFYSDPKTNTETALNLADPSCKAVSEVNRTPWRFVSQHDAALACSRAGKRLLTADEWYKAALGTPDSLFGYVSDGCNVARNREDGPALTGSGMRCVSDAGIFDMVGNVWEWVDGVVEKGQWKGRTVPPSGYVSDAATDGIAYSTASTLDERFGGDRFWSDTSIDAGILRGGYYDSKGNAGIFATYAASPMTFAGDAVGFRCAVTPLGA